MQASSPNNDWLSGNSGGSSWERKFLLFPRLGLKLGERGVSRKLLLPGIYETRMSRSIGKRIYREVSA